MVMFRHSQYLVKVTERLWSWFNIEKVKSKLKHSTDCVLFIIIYPKPQSFLTNVLLFPKHAQLRIKTLVFSVKVRCFGKKKNCQLT